MPHRPLLCSALFCISRKPGPGKAFPKTNHKVETLAFPGTEATGTESRLYRYKDGRINKWYMWRSKDKEQGELKGPTLPERRVTGLLSLCHAATTAMSQRPPKQHALPLSHPYKERYLPRSSPAQHAGSIHSLPSQQMTRRFPGCKNRQATHAQCRLSPATRKSACRSGRDPSL